MTCCNIHDLTSNGQVSYFPTKFFLSTHFQVEVAQETLQARVDATANEVRAFARAYASAVESHCLSLLHCLEDVRVQRRYGAMHVEWAKLCYQFLFGE